MRNLCGIIVPRQEEIIDFIYDDGKYLAECIRGACHNGPHVFLTPEGKYIQWEDDLDCGCCRPEEDEPCYTYNEITKEEFLALERLHAKT